MQEAQEMWVQSLGWEDALEKEILQYSCLENSIDRGAWRATVVGSQSVRHDLATKQQQQSGFKSVPSSHHGSQVS